MRFSREENVQCEGVLLFAQHARRRVREGESTSPEHERELNPCHCRWIVCLWQEESGMAAPASPATAAALLAAVVISWL